MDSDNKNAAVYLRYFSKAIATRVHPLRGNPSQPPANNRTPTNNPKNHNYAASNHPSSFIDFPPLATHSKPSLPHVDPAPQLHNTANTKQVVPTSGFFPQPATPQYHVACIQHHPHLLPSSLQALVNIIRICSTQEIALSVAGHATSEALINHAAQVITRISHLLPHPLRLSLSTIPPLSHLRPSPTTFPIPSGPSWTPPLPLSPTNEHPPLLSQRLTAKLEIAWDATLALQRRFRGELRTCPPGTFDPSFASKILSDLHPATTDVYAARFIHLVSAASLTDTDPKMRRLDARMRSADATPQNAAVVLHRLPAVVRRVFHDHAHMFFLEFLTAVDSARLYAALTPRLARALANAMCIAAGATSNVAFSEAVVDARLFAKLLCVVLNAPNWAHSEFAVSGGGDGQGLSLHALRGRMAGHEAAWTTNFDVAKVLVSALENGSALAIFASVAVADVVMRLSAVDPVAKEAKWYDKALTVLKGLDANTRGTGKFPLLDCVLVDLLDGELCNSGMPLVQGGCGKDNTWEALNRAEECYGIGNERLMNECCPDIAALRQAIESNSVPDAPIPPNGKRPTRRIQPVAAEEMNEKSGNDNVDSRLKREFVRRMDGKLRELIGVVATARAGNSDGAESAYAEIANILYPGSAETVVHVAARLCGERSKSMEAKRRQRNDFDSKPPPEQQNKFIGQGQGSIETGRRATHIDSGDDRSITTGLPLSSAVGQQNKERMERLERRLTGTRIGFRAQESR